MSNKQQTSATTTEDETIMECDFKFKVCLLGDSYVGKSWLLARLCGDDVLDVRGAGGVNVKFRRMEQDGSTVKLQIWDLWGLPRLRKFLASYCRWSHGVIVIYDVTDQRSFDSVKDWKEVVDGIDESTSACSQIVKFLVANKCDVDDEQKKKRVISPEQGRASAESLGMEFWEVSAKTNSNVEEALSSLVSQLIKADEDSWYNNNDTTASGQREGIERCTIL